VFFFFYSLLGSFDICLRKGVEPNRKDKETHNAQPCPCVIKHFRGANVYWEPDASVTEIVGSAEVGGP